MLIINPNVSTVQSKCELGPAPGFSWPFLGVLALRFCLYETHVETIFMVKSAIEIKLELKFEKAATTGSI